MTQRQSYKRKHYFIDKSFQAKFILNFSLIVLGASGLTLILLFLLTGGSNTVAIENTRVVVKTTAEFILPITLYTIIIVFIFSSVAVIALTVFFSHKISGPLYRLTKEVEALTEGDLTRKFKTRGNDQLKVLSDKFLIMAELLRTHCKDLKELHKNLKTVLEEKDFNLSSGDKTNIKRLLKEIDEKLNRFKIS